MVWIGGAALAGLSGVLLGLTQGFNYQLGFKILLLVFAAVVLGGLGTIWGAIVGAFVIGIFIEVSTLFIPAELKYVGALVVLIIVLLIRPQGLLGKAAASRLRREKTMDFRTSSASRCSRPSAPPRSSTASRRSGSTCTSATPDCSTSARPASWRSPATPWRRS